MIKHSDKVVMIAVAICFKPYLKPEEACIYCHLERTQFAKRCEQFGVYKNDKGYFKKEDLHKLMAGKDESPR